MDKYEIKLEDINFEGLTALSLVEFPAIEVPFIKMSKLKYSIDDEKRIITGPALIANTEIDRGLWTEYWSEEVIRQAVPLFFKNNNNNNINIEHSNPINDVIIFESWIVEDSEKDKSALLGYNLPVGSWCVSLKVYNEDIWNIVKLGLVRGFSIEGWFSQKLVKQSKEEPSEKDIINEIVKLIDKII